MAGHKLYGLPTPTLNNEPATKGQSDADYLSKAGGAFIGELSMSNQKIIDLGYPTGSTDAATKEYVDTKSFSISGDVDMKGHRLTGLLHPSSDSDAATKKWVMDDFPTKSEVLNGFTLLGPLDMGGHKIYELRTPTNDKDAANKKYVDGHSGGVFKDGTTTTKDIDLRKVLNSTGFFNDVTFHSGAYSQDITAASPSNSVVNKNSLQSEGLVGLNSLVPTLKGLLHTLQEQKFDADISLLVLKGTVSSHTVEHKDSSLVNNVVLRRVGNDTQLTIHFKKVLTHGIYSYEFDISSDHTSGFDIYMYGECGGTGFRSLSKEGGSLYAHELHLG